MSHPSSRPSPHLTRRQGFTALAGLTAGVLGTGALSSCSSSSASEELVFAAVPAESSQSLEQTFGHIVTLLEQATGRTVTFQNASDYAAVIEGQRAGKVDIASYGPFSYVIARDSGIALEAIAAPVHEEGSEPSYTSLCYTTPGSGITSLADLAGKKVAFVDKASTSGYLVPLEGLMREELDVDADLETVLAGGHDASLLALAGGEVDAAFAHDTMLTTLTESGQIEADALTPIWESEPIPEDPIAVNTSTLDAGTIDAIRTAIQTKANKPALVEEGICTSEDDCELPEEIEWGYVAVSDEDYEPIRRLCTVTEADACTSVS
ncbi:phosphate/phosphite/phosphonate ABC transporter substrate-binding protein [Brachybacterium sacelli]|uniref:Phosphonate transport system substrate-binding protein n=1 Tax=Brachybacterium sacelli TaxID=173364 RepID=A0ABS4WVQ2_9MICO|nr:phosphate/phosphite/phosphonate ABC transporter substrate-binding protein [Brachybacterium sacelli]MBP2380287.1 phosphonate transport system substrate-binding protein [Brachybacterium sacelli]